MVGRCFALGFAVAVLFLASGGMGCGEFYLYDERYGPGCWRVDDEDTGSLLLGWHSDVVDSSGEDAGLFSSIAVDANDMVHISYFRVRVTVSPPDDWDDECENNSPPRLLGVHYFLGEQEIEPPVVITTDALDEFRICFEYEDVDCNLDGGGFYIRFLEPESSEWVFCEELPDLGCSSEESGYMHGFGWPADLEPGHYRGLTMWTDACRDGSNEMEWEFDLVAAGDDDDDDDDAGDDDFSRGGPVKNDGVWSYHYELKHACGNRGFWNIQHVRRVEPRGWDTSIAVAPDGSIYVSFCAGSKYSSSTKLYYVYYKQGAWGDMSLDYMLGKVDSCDTSIGVDSSGFVHIAYVARGGIKYATDAYGSWQTYEVDCSEGRSFGDPSIAVEPDGTVHIAYCDMDDGRLMYATGTPGNWSICVVDGSGGLGFYNDIAVDSRGGVHISYYDRANKHLKYATNSGGFWRVEVVDSHYGAGSYTSIALDSSDAVHVSYRSATNSALKYATNKEGQWAVYTVDSRGDTGYFTSIALDSKDYVHISYFNNSTDDLMYVTNRP